jgi:hypothetical protein
MPPASSSSDPRIRERVEIDGPVGEVAYPGAMDPAVRERAELALKWRGITLADLLPTWGILRPERWPDHPLVRDFVMLTAVQALQARDVAAGHSETAALRRACERLGLRFETVRSRLRASRTARTRAREAPAKSGGNPTQPSRNAG